MPQKSHFRGKPVSASIKNGFSGQDALRIHKRAGNSRKIGGAFSENSYSSSPWIGNSGHMIERTGGFAVSATCALSVINLYSWHLYSPVL
jgi:hypothetical protein